MQRKDDHEMNASRKIIRNVTLTGMACNILLTAGKFLAGFFCHSHALVADAVHSLSDLTTDLAILIGVRYWSAPPDAGHPYGHGRIETIITVVIGVILAAVGVSIALDAVQSLRSEGHATPPGMPAFLTALVSIILKEALYRWTLYKAHEVHSSALEANAWHQRSDAISSIPAALSVGVASFFPSWAFLDSIGAILVSLFILHAAWKIMCPPLMQLADAGAPQTIEEIRRIALSVPGAVSVHCIRTRLIGAKLQADLHLMVPPTMTVREGHRISSEIHDRLVHSALQIQDVVVHIEPTDDDSPEDEFSGSLQQ